MDIAPFRGLRFNLAALSRRGIEAPAAAVTAPPYDVISAADHRSLLEGCEYNIAALTLGETPGEVSDYESRRRKLEEWLRSETLVEDPEPGFYVYEIDYAMPAGAASGGRRRFLGLLGLGRLHPFGDRVVLPHEQTFPKVVDDRLRLLEETRTHLESIFLLYADPDRAIDGILAGGASGDAVVRVEAKPGERHSLHRIDDAAVTRDLQERFREQRPIIADGHHRYTTGLRYRAESGAAVPGSEWQLMTFANLFGDGLAILATHRLVRLEGLSPRAAFELLRERLEEVGEGEARDLRVETAAGAANVRFPASLRRGRSGVAATSYALLDSVVLGDWLAGYVPEGGVSYFKEGTGEQAALERGDGDVLFRMQPVDRGEFRQVVQGGEVYPHKTTYFYPKLWSGLALWRIADPHFSP